MHNYALMEESSTIKMKFHCFHHILDFVDHAQALKIRKNNCPASADVQLLYRRNAFAIRLSCTLR